MGWKQRFFFQFQVVAPGIDVLKRYMCGASLQEYQSSGGERDEEILARLFFLANTLSVKKSVESD